MVTERASVAPDDIYLQQVFGHYHSRLLYSDSVQGCLEAKGIELSLLWQCHAGICDRTLGKCIPRSTTIEGAACRGSLRRLGLLKASGHQLLLGCLVVPVFCESGSIIGAFGLRLASRIRRSAPRMLYWQHRPCKEHFELPIIEELKRAYQA